MKTLQLLAALTLLTVSGFADSAIGFQPSDSILSVLKKQIGQRVELRLKSGEKIGGKIEGLGEKLVHLSSITGMEFYEAVVAVDDVSAIVVRAAAK